MFYYNKFIFNFLFLQRIFNLNNFNNNHLDIKSFYKKKYIQSYKKIFRFLIKYFFIIIKRIILRILFIVKSQILI